MVDERAVAEANLGARQGRELDAGREAKAVIEISTADSPLPQGTSVSVRPTEDGWLLHFDTGETAFEVEAGYGGWRESSPLGRPVVAVGAWQGGLFYDICGDYFVSFANASVAGVANLLVLALLLALTGKGVRTLFPVSFAQLREKGS